MKKKIFFSVDQESAQAPASTSVGSAPGLMGFLQDGSGTGNCVTAVACLLISIYITDSCHVRVKAILKGAPFEALSKLLM
jgi:hypothetical protein